MKRTLPCLALVLAIVLPFFQTWHIAPVSDWMTNATALAFIALALLFFLGRAGATQLPRVFTPLLMLSVLLMTMRHDDLPFLAGLFLVLSWLALQLGSWEEHEKRGFVAMLAWGVLLAALLQAGIGLVQALKMEPSFHGWVLYWPNQLGGVMGNFGQRNQLAQFLAWGMLAAAYLYAMRRLALVALLPSLLFLALILAWSGARLPLAYGLGLLVLAWFWHRRTSQDAALSRMAGALALAMLLSALLQVFNHDILRLLNAWGLPLLADSGSERFLDAGFGARRYVEWHKAWSVFLQHPWLGVGLGGYGWHSAWLEVYGGWDKVPESWLFTQCHNLFFQLLAETGLIGTGIVLGGLVYCLWPYFKRGQQTPENLLLIGIAMMVLGHSMFEYPLWYLPFLLMLVLICALSPAPAREVNISAGFRRGMAGMLGTLCLAYIGFSLPGYRTATHNFMPGPKPLENMRSGLRMAELARNPLWSWEGELGMINYLQPGFPLPLQRELLERVVRKQPFATPLVKLAIVRALDKDAAGAKEAMLMAIVNYPDYVPVFVNELRPYPQVQLEPLREMAGRAMQAGIIAGPNTGAGRLAVVRSVLPPLPAVKP